MTQEQLKTVFSNIRSIREFRNYSQDYLAMKLGISQNAYSKIELGYTNITLWRLYQIAEVLEVDIMDILNLNMAQLEKVFPQKIR